MLFLEVFAVFAVLWAQLQRYRTGRVKYLVVLWISLDTLSDGGDFVSYGADHHVGRKLVKSFCDTIAIMTYLNWCVFNRDLIVDIFDNGNQQ